MGNYKMGKQTLLLTCLLIAFSSTVIGRVAFEKLTELDYPGTTYYTIRNLSLWECQGWCREEIECAAASFSFVMNPLATTKETLCRLQNATNAVDPWAKPQRAVSLYYMVKLDIRTDKVCNRPWTFERVPNMMLKDLDNAMIFTNTKEDCLATCLNERRFVCRSAEFNYVTLQCYLSEHDRRSVQDNVELIEVKGVDYFENLCLGAAESCREDREYVEPMLGVPADKIAHYVNNHLYVDKELMANSAAACKRACQIEPEFLCRSLIYKGLPTGTSYNCQLFHLDHYTLPDGPSTFLTTDRPLIDDGQRTGTYFENICKRSLDGGGLTAGPVPATGIEDGQGSSTTKMPFPIPAGGTGDNTGGSTGTEGDGNINCDSSGVCYEVSVHCKDTRIVVDVSTNKAFNGRIYALGRSETCNVDVINSNEFRLDLTMGGQDCNTQSAGGVYTNTVVIQHHSVVMTKTDKIYKVRCTYDMSSKNITFGMVPIRDPDMIPITSAPVAPPPRIRILDGERREVETVRIGDKLTFVIELSEESVYGIFARSCVAMAKDSRSTFQIIDDDGCPVEPAIFPHFDLVGTSLQAVYEAFRFTESYGVIFQCNVKYCLGQCEPANCLNSKSYGRKKRGLSDPKYRKSRGYIQETTKEEAMSSLSTDDEMSISQEILVLDFGDDQNTQLKQDSKLSAKDNYYTNSTYTFDANDVMLFETCPTRSSVLALAVTCAILLLIYVLTVFYFVMRKWIRPPSKSLQ